jgi:hypothetical protein
MLCIDPADGATWRSGYATVCKTVYTSSILVVASIYQFEIIALFNSSFVPWAALATALLPNGFWRSILNGDLQLSIDHRGGILLHSRHHMAVKIQGDADAAVA